MEAEALLELVRGHWGVENGLHRILDVQFREDDCRLRRGHAPAVMAILRRTALNMVKTFQQPFEPDVSMGLLRDRIGRQPWLRSWPERNFPVALTQLIASTCLIIVKLSYTGTRRSHS